MLQYIGRRVLQFIPVFLGVTLMLFLISNYMPGADPIQMRLGEKSISPEIKQQLIESYGLDDPWYIQYLNYLSDLMPVHVVDGQITWTGPDLGTSIYNGRPVSTILQETYPFTIRLAFAAILIEIVAGIGAGIISAVKRYSFWDVFVTMTTSILVSLPVFWLGMLLQYAFGIWLKEATNGAFYLPISGAESAQFGPTAHLILPAITLASVSTAYAARIMRSQLLEVNGQDYVRTAYAKGLSGRQVLMGHSMKNALIPVVTFIGLDLGAMFAGAVLTETVFNWPGVGFTIARSIFQRDFPVVFGGVTVMLFAVMIVNLLVDISYAFLDPRIRYGGSEGD
ncbi:MAG: ABC transporter permease [Actinobacteria bacterium]|nr:MAG: ABC transporter permease [Actinomycetota bacterium]